MLTREIYTTSPQENRNAPSSQETTTVGINSTLTMVWKSTDLLGLLLDSKYCSEDGFRLDANGNRIEDDNYQLLPGKKAEVWDQYLWINSKGDASIDDDEYRQLSSKARASYHKVACMVAHLCQIEQRIYVPRFGIDTSMIEADSLANAGIKRRYQYECQHSRTFAELCGGIFDRRANDREYLRPAPIDDDYYGEEG